MTERAEAIDLAYSTLMDLLRSEPQHGPDCVWRCLNEETCRADHGCDVCGDDDEGWTP